MQSQTKQLALLTIAILSLTPNHVTACEEFMVGKKQWTLSTRHATDQDSTRILEFTLCQQSRSAQCLVKIFESSPYSRKKNYATLTRLDKDEGMDEGWPFKRTFLDYALTVLNDYLEKSAIAPLDTDYQLYQVSKDKRKREYGFPEQYLAPRLMTKQPQMKLYGGWTAHGCIKNRLIDTTVSVFLSHQHGKQCWLEWDDYNAINFIHYRETKGQTYELVHPFEAPPELVNFCEEAIQKANQFLKRSHISLPPGYKLRTEHSEVPQRGYFSEIQEKALIQATRRSAALNFTSQETQTEAD